MKTCKECYGKGEYEVKNAYDPKFSKLVKCEYCKVDTKSNG